MKQKLQFKHTLTLVDTETECVEVEVEVEANYYPAEAEVRYYADGSGHPGSDDEVEVTKVTRKDDGVELDWDALPASCKDTLEEEVRILANDGGY